MGKSHHQTVAAPVQFKTIVNLIAALCVILLALSVGLSCISTPTEAQKSLFTMTAEGWKMCLAAFLGLLGGRATDVK